MSENIKTNREKLKIQKREHILESALRVFAKMGYNQSKISAIAKEAGIADGTIYIYFKKKEDILIAIFEEKMTLFNSILEKNICKESSPISQLKQFITTHLSVLCENHYLAGLFTVELRQSTRFIKNYSNIKFREYLGVLKGIIVDGQNQKIFRDDLNISLLWKMIFGILDQISLSWVLKKSKQTQDEIEQVVNEINHFITNGIIVKEE
ncbi:TetR/AcrR family transcriptional regulator [bacterium]|nr:TetR/AcrR family transcriptional regulator [bacterium]